MDQFNHILNWELKKGSHEFPGPSGGTCINEVAAVVAGFEYRSINSWRDCPPCFSPIVSQWAIGLNDGMTDENRQALIRFAPLMAGTKGSSEIEVSRAHWLAIELARVDIADICARVPALQRHEAELRAVTNIDECRSALKSAIANANAYANADADADAIAIAYAIANANANANAIAIANAIANANAKQHWLKTRGVQLLEGLIAINPGPEIQPALIVERATKAMEAAL